MAHRSSGKSGFKTFQSDTEKKEEKTSTNKNPPVPKTMEEEYKSLAKDLISKAEEAKRNGKKYIIGIAGAPGSGKTTTAFTINRLINEACPDTSVMVPMDGFHYYKSQLDKMDDPQEAYRRRGAPFTFWAEGLLNLLKKIRETGEAKAPSFDHSVGDPVEDDIPVNKSHTIVIVEGNYILLNEKPWNEISQLLDENWFIDCDLDTAMERVRVRHIAELSLNDAQAKERINTNDRPNAELVRSKKVKVDKVILSV